MDWASLAGSTGVTPTLPVLLTPGRGVAISTGKKPRELFIAKLYRLEELAECLESMLVSRDWAAAGRSKPKSR